MTGFSKYQKISVDPRRSTHDGREIFFETLYLSIPQSIFRIPKQRKKVLKAVTEEEYIICSRVIKEPLLTS